MKFVQRLFCRIGGHKWSRMQRTNAAGGQRTCKRCGEIQVGPMRTLFGRKRAAQAHDTIQV